MEDNSFLPMANFSIDNSSDEEDEKSNNGHVQIFSRNNYLTSKGIVIEDENAVKEEGGENEQNESGNNDNSVNKHIITDDLVIEDIEEDEDETQSGDTAAHNDDNDWIKFQSQFQSVLDSSDTIIVNETTLAKQLEILKNDLVATAVQTLVNEREEGTEEEEKKENSFKEIQLSIENKGEKDGNNVLYSNSYNQINENELDVLLKSIEEENVTATTSSDNIIPFQWESILSKDTENDQLMNQLQVANDYRKQQYDKYCSVLKSPTTTTTTNQSSLSFTASTSSSNDSSVGINSTDEPVHMDLRPLNSVQSNDEMSQSAKRLMSLRLSGKTVSLEDNNDEEESYDLDSWKEERQKYKSPTKNIKDKRSSSLQEEQQFSPAVINKVRTRLTSSGSISEDEVFVTTSVTSTEGSSLSEKEELSAMTVSSLKPPLPQTCDGNKSSKKKKSKGGNGGRQRKGSGGGSGSDGEGKGKKKSHSKSSKKQHKDYSSSTKTSSRKHNNSGSSLTQSSDEDQITKEDIVISNDKKITGGGVIVVGRSLSEGDGDRSKLQLLLQQKIESRKPPSIFNTPNTPPLFHTDVSFTDVLPSINPSLTTTTCTLSLPLTEYGMIDMDTIDLPSITLSQRTSHVLHIIILTWLIGLIEKEREENENEIWRPFNVSGLMQTIIDGMAYIVICVNNNDTDVIQILSQSNLGQIINSILALIPAHINTSTNNGELVSISDIPLSNLFTLQNEDSSRLSTPLSFYVHSFYTSNCLPSIDTSLKSTATLQSTLCTIHEPHLNNLVLIFDLLFTVTSQGLDISGLRLVYSQNQLVLAIALRGSDAVSRLVDIVGPQDHTIALVTDPHSLSSRYVSMKEKEPLIHCVHSQYWAKMELAKWFGGRACLRSGTILGVSDINTRLERRKRQRVRFSESESEELIPLPEDIDYPPLISNRPTLLVYPYTKIILIASPCISPQYYSTLLESISRAGFDLHGIKRIRLNFKRAQSLCIPPDSLPYFTPTSAPVSPALVHNNLSPLTSTTSLTNNSSISSLNVTSSHFPPLPSLLLVLGRENALFHSEFLLKETTLSLHKLSSEINKDFNAPMENIIHVMNFTDEMLKIIGNFTFTPSAASTARLSPLLLEEKGHKEEICFVAIPNHMCMSSLIDTLSAVCCCKGVEKEGRKTSERGDLGDFELLGIKIVPSISRFQAKQLCPYALNSIGFQETVDFLCGKPVALLILRGLNSNERVRALIKGFEHQSKLEIRPGKKEINVISTEDLNKAFHLTSLFFIDKELFSHPLIWPWANMVPHSWLNDCAILSSLTIDPDPLLSVFTVSLSQLMLLIKVLEKLSRLGFSFVAINMTNVAHSPTAVEERQKEPIGLSVAVCVQRYSAVWYLSHQLKLFTLSSPVYDKAIYYSPTFTSAVADVQLYFPFGVDSTSPALHKYYQVSTPTTTPLLITDSSHDNITSYNDTHSINHLLPLPSSPLSEDAYIILPPSYLSLIDSSFSSSFPFITVLDILNRAKFSLIDIFTIPLSSQTIKEISLLLEFTDQVEEYSREGSCIVIGVRRDNAASCFHSIITNSLHQYSIREDTGKIAQLFQSILVTKTTHQTTAVKAILKHT